MAVGRSIPMLDAVDRVTGRVPYTGNLRLPGMLVAKVLRSQMPHAILKKVDARAAESLPGVVAVLTAADFDGPDQPRLHYGAILKDQPVVARERVRYIGEPVALVAAESDEAAERALDMIEVEYEELPGVYEAQAAFSPGAPVLHEDFPDNCFVHAKLRQGDLEAGFAAADDVIEETYTSPVAQHSSLEAHTSIAHWDKGMLTVWTATQAPYTVRRALAEIFRIDPHNVRVVVPPVGGGYGGKGHLRVEPMVAALARKAGGRPVKLALSRAEEFVTVTKHAATITIKTGVRRDGTLTARQVTITWGAGAYADASPGLVRASILRALGPYRFPAAQVDAYGVYTNLPPAGAFRGAMSSQTTWAYESHMDLLAHHLGISPLALRTHNLLKDGDTFITGESLHDIHFEECLQSVANCLGWESRTGQPQAEHPAKNSGNRKRGRGLAVMIKSTVATSKSQSRLVLSDDGLLTVFTSSVEMGQGTHTALAQIAAEELGLPVEWVRITGPDTAITPFDTTTSASRSVNMMGNAVRNAARNLLDLLVEAATPLLEVPAEELDAREGTIFDRSEPERRLPYHEVLRRQGLEELEALGEFSTSGQLDPETGQGTGSPHYHQGAGACEVEVDVQTGKVTVLRYCSASFAGRVVNPGLARLQNDGNVIYGLGPALMEEMVFSEGQILNPNLSDYQIPSLLDTPPEMKSTSLESPRSDFHGIGEMTLPPVAPAIANAIYDAIGVRIRELPITAEKVLRAYLDGAD